MGICVSTTDDKSVLIDGFNVLSKGVNSGVTPDRLPREALAFSINGTMRKGKVHPRPGIDRRPLRFDPGNPDEPGYVPDKVKNAFENGYFQGMGVHIWARADSEDATHLLVSISGHIFRIDLASFDCTDVSNQIIDASGNPKPEPNPSNRRQAWFEQMEMFTVIQDGQSAPLIYDGARLKRSDVIKGQVPVGTLMKYALGRLTVVLPDGRAFAAGNIVGSEEGNGTIQYNFRDSVLWFTENNLLASGGVFAARDRITALHEIQIIDKTVNQDPLFIFNRRGGNLANYPRVREEWFTTQMPIVVGGLRSVGPAGPCSTIAINSDLWLSLIHI